MPSRIVPVAWQVATDPKFRDVVAGGAELAHPESAHSVHVELAGLQPGREYFYRFRAEGELSPVGCTKTTPALGTTPARFAFAFASCQNYPAGYYTAYDHMAGEDLDLVAFLGDYIYEGDGQGGVGRGHLPDAEIWSLADYRVRLAQYKTDPSLQATHAAFPWALVYDDHEVENNYAGDISQDDGDPAVFRARRARAYQAYYEHMPLRRAQRPNGGDLSLYRRLRFGDLVDMWMLDTRQYRSDQVSDAERGNPDRTMLGAQQRQWLEAGLAGPTGTWNVLAQQVFFSQRDLASGTAEDFSNDAWDNYQVERDRIRDHMVTAGTSNPVVITGDVHANYLVDVKQNWDDPASATVATEIVGTSITSGGDGRDQGAGDPGQLADNPWIKMINRQRGYVRNVITPDAWRIDYRVLDFVTLPGSPIHDRASYVIEQGAPGAQPA
jgi:alkaline phosphatase D